MELTDRVILDTDFLSYFLIQKKSAVLMMEKLVLNGSDPVSTSITKAEMFFGACKKGWGNKRMNTLRELFGSLEILSFTSKTSEIYGELRADLVQNGLDIGFADIAIASVAIENDCAVLTGNTAHFSRIQDIRVIKLDL